MNGRRVVITGMGAMSVLGLTLDDISRSLRDGKSGLDIDPERKTRGFRSPLTGVVKGFDAKARFDRKQRKTMSQAALYGCAAALEAVADAKLTEAHLRRPEAGIIFGNDSTCESARLMFDELVKHGRTQLLGSGPIIQIMNSTVTMNLSSMLGVQGACWTLSAACASGLHSVGQAAMLIASGQQELVVAGGAQETAWEGMAAFDALGALSTRESEPATASRPFDLTRDGLVPSGGGAAVVLETLESARARGARIYGEVLSYAFSCDGEHLTNPTGDGALRAMRQALKLASVAPAEVDYVNAHATSTPIGDATEARAVHTLFGETQVPVSSTKGLTGHECWMAGASEVIYALLMMRDGFIAGNPHLTTPDPQCSMIHLPPATLPQRPRTVLKNSFGFGGTNAAMVLRAVEGA